MEKRLTKEQYEAYQARMKNGMIDYDVRNLIVGDDEQSRIKEDLKGKSVEEIASNREVPLEIAQLYYNFVNSNEDDDYQKNWDSLLDALIPLTSWPELLEKSEEGYYVNDDLFENLALEPDDWEAFDEMQDEDFTEYENPEDEGYDSGQPFEIGELDDDEEPGDEIDED